MWQHSDYGPNKGRRKWTPFYISCRNKVLHPPVNIYWYGDECISKLLISNCKFNADSTDKPQWVPSEIEELLTQQPNGSRFHYVSAVLFVWYINHPPGMHLIWGQTCKLLKSWLSFCGSERALNGNESKRTESFGLITARCVLQTSRSNDSALRLPYGPGSQQYHGSLADKTVCSNSHGFHKHDCVDERSLCRN